MNIKDKILDKISKDGLNNISLKEKEYLDSLSKNDKSKSEYLENYLYKYYNIYDKNKKLTKFGLNEFELLQKDCDQFMIFLITEVIKDIHGDNESIDGFLKDILLALSNIRKSEFEKSLKKIYKYYKFFDKTIFYKRYYKKSWFNELCYNIDVILEKLEYFI